MTRAITELQAESERLGIAPGRITRLWLDDFQPHDPDKAGFYWSPLDSTQTRPEPDQSVFLGKTSCEAMEKLPALPKAKQAKKQSYHEDKRINTPHTRRRGRSHVTTNRQ